MLFDAPVDIPGIVVARDLIYVSFADGFWYNRRPGVHMHLFNGFNNGNSADLSRKKVR